MVMTGAVVGNAVGTKLPVVGAMVLRFENLVGRTVGLSVGKEVLADVGAPVCEGLPV